MLIMERKNSMNRAIMQQRASGADVASSTAKRRLSGSRLILARIVWLVLVIPSLGLTVISFPVYYAQIQKPCVDATTCNIAGAMKINDLQALVAHGVSANSYATF